MEVDRYKDAGVNVKEGESFSAFASRMRKTTFGNCRYVRVHDFSGGDFRGPEDLFLKTSEYPFLRTCGLAVNTDGVGTKTMIVSEADEWVKVGYDLIAMLEGDSTRYGHLPIASSNVLDVRTLGTEGDKTNLAFREVIEGLVRAANAMGVVLIGGETAELGVGVGSENPTATTIFNWSGFMLSLSCPTKRVLGDKLREGQIIVALKENGFRSNGISLVRQAFR